jgi:hypothetical protein
MADGPAECNARFGECVLYAANMQEGCSMLNNASLDGSLAGSFAKLLAPLIHF